MDSVPLAAQLLRAADWFNDALLERIAAAGWPRLSRNQAQVFPLLGERGVSQAEIARRLGITRQSVNVLVGELVDIDVLAKTSDDSDARSTVIVLTGIGRRLAADAREILGDLERTLAERIGAEAVESLRHALGADWGTPPMSHPVERDHDATLPERQSN